MRYYVTADVHSYFTLFKTALTEAGFFDDPEPHKLIICGDLFDRGKESLELQEFILDLMEKDQVILIRGNHEDLAWQLLVKWPLRSYLESHHHWNGTIDTVCQLTGKQLRDVYDTPASVGLEFRDTPFIRQILHEMPDYFETDHYIFVHGWIPCTVSKEETGKEYSPIADWRSAEKSQWDKARWINGMEAARKGIREPGKTIVCGHWHCSFGHANYENDGPERGSDANCTPYYGQGIIALDANTADSGKVNCIVIED